MSANSPIEWTDHTFNIAWGCMKVSPGCQHCYADTLSQRYGHKIWGPAKTTSRRTFGDKHWAEPIKWNRKAEAEGVRRRVFCSSMCDVFEEHSTIDQERAKLWPLIRATPWLDWQLLTKRPERIRENLPSDWGSGWPNVWLGTSVESQPYVGRIKELASVAARVKFLSAEPLLGPLDLTTELYYATHRSAATGTVRLFLKPITALDWVIVGGESGPQCRRMDPQWASDLQHVCAKNRVPFFLKQLGGFPDKRGHEKALLDGKRYIEMPRAA